MERFLGARPDTLSFYEFEESEVTTHTVENAELGELYEFAYQALNIESEAFPFEQNTYDLVLCCEVLEHLLINPSHMLYEVHRVLRPGGYILITTPNVLRWSNLFSMVRGLNIYDRYHGNGIYGRHNREYSSSEVSQLLEANGYEVERLETRNVYGQNPALNLSSRRDNIFALARSVGEAKVGFPENLYVLMEEYRNVARSRFKMGVDEIGQIGKGWYDVEVDSIPFRWSSQTAKFYLRNQGSAQVVLRARCAHPHVESAPVTVTLNVNGSCVGSAKLVDHSWHDLAFSLGGSTTKEILSCEIAISNVWVPSLETQSDDSRSLGIAVHSIRLE
jgi:SAM-dependent methyltransferase